MDCDHNDTKTTLPHDCATSPTGGDLADLDRLEMLNPVEHTKVWQISEIPALTLPSFATDLRASRLVI